MQWYKLENSDFKNFPIGELANKYNNKVFYYIPENYKKSFVEYLEAETDNKEEILTRINNIHKVALLVEHNFRGDSIESFLINISNDLIYQTTKMAMSLYNLDIGLPKLLEYSFGFLKSKDNWTELNDGVMADENNIEAAIKKFVLLESDEYIIAFQKNNMLGEFKDGIVLTNKRIISIGKYSINIKWSEVKSYNRNFFNKAKINGVDMGSVLNGIDEIIKSMMGFDYISFALIERTKSFAGNNEAYIIISRNKFNNKQNSLNSINDNLQDLQEEEKSLEIQLLNKNNKPIDKWDITKSSILIGRSSSKGEVDIDLKNIENGEYISRKHGKIYKRDNRWYYVDLNSKYGTKLISCNEEAILAADTEYELEDGDVLLLADEILLKIILKRI